jgi:hypothetical protein
MLVPAHTRAGSECLGDTLLGLERPERRQERAREVNAAVRAGQCESLLLGHREGTRGRVIFDVPADAARTAIRRCSGD